MDLMKLKRQLDEAQELAARKIAILWGPGDLLAEAIESILTTAGNWLVIKISDTQDVSWLVREVEKVKPAIVIVNQSRGSENLPAPISIIENFP